MLKKLSGFSLLEVMIVVAVIGILSAILIPAVMRANLIAQQKTCVSNLREIDQAIQLWALETKAEVSDVVVHSNLVPYLRILPTCPCPATNAGTFFTDYGMTFVKDPAYCTANNGLAGNPHQFIPNPVPPLAVKPLERNIDPTPKQRNKTPIPAEETSTSPSL